MEELDIIRNYLEDVYYEFGEDSDFFKENLGKLSQRQKDLLKRLFDFRRSYFESIESKISQDTRDALDELVEKEDEISDLECENQDLIEENSKLERTIEEMESEISDLENTIDELKEKISRVEN